MTPGLDRLSDPGVHAFYCVRRVDDLSDVVVEAEERDELGPGVLPQAHDGGNAIGHVIFSAVVLLDPLNPGIRRAFDAQGIVALFEGKRGRKGPLKASVEVVEFVRAAKAADPSLSGAQIARLVNQQFSVELHRRTVERLLEPKSGARRVTAKGA